MIFGAGVLNAGNAHKPVGTAAPIALGVPFFAERDELIPVDHRPGNVLGRKRVLVHDPFVANGNVVTRQK